MALLTLNALMGALNPMQRMGVEFIGAGIKRGLSGNAVGRLLVGTPMGMSRFRIRQVARYYRQQFEAMGKINSLTISAQPKQSDIPISPFRQREKYNYIVGYTIDGENVGQSQIGHLTVESSRILSRSEAEELAQMIVDTNRENYLRGDVLFDLELVTQRFDDRIH